MPYVDRFLATDGLIQHLQPIIPTIHDPQVLSNYTGFLAVSSITVYELAIKDIFNEFAKRKNLSFGNFVEKHFEKLNGRIKIRDIKDNVKTFGEKYSNRFTKKINIEESLQMTNLRVSMMNCYDNLLTCRHKFVHAGIVTLSIQEVIANYTIGKNVIHILDRTMVR